MPTTAEETNAAPEPAKDAGKGQSDQGLTVMPKRGAPVKLTGTWDGARKWLDYAGQFERAKLFCQVMLGFELLELRKTTPHGHSVKAALCGQTSESRTFELHNSQATSSGSRTRLAQHAVQHNPENWEETLELELKPYHTSRTTAYAYMAMARAAAPQIRKRAGLREIDLVNSPISSLTTQQQKLLTGAVRKISDGKTQQEFCADLGIYKGLGGKKVGRKPGDGGRPREDDGTIEEQAARRRERALKWAGRADEAIERLGTDFMALPDEQNTALVARLDRTLRCVREWLKTPPTKRNMQAIADLWKTL